MLPLLPTLQKELPEFTYIWKVYMSARNNAISVQRNYTKFAHDPKKPRNGNSRNEVMRDGLKELIISDLLIRHMTWKN